MQILQSNGPAKMVRIKAGKDDSPSQNRRGLLLSSGGTLKSAFKGSLADDGAVASSNGSRRNRDITNLVKQA